MDPDFEAEFADELEALQDLDDDIDQYATKSRKSLDFSTPSTQRHKRKTLDDSLYLPLDSPASKDSNSGQFNGLRNHSAQKVTQSNNNSNKRKGDELYGDLSDDEDDLNLQIDEPDLPDVVPVRKKQRMSSQPLPQPEEEIPDGFEFSPPSSPGARKKVSNRSNIVSVNERMREYLSQTSDNYDLDRPRVLRRIPAGRFLPCTSTEGARVYMSMKGHEFLQRQMAESVVTGQRSLQLLGTPLGVLKAQADEERHRKELEEAQNLLDRADSVGQDQDESSDDESDETKPALWVERYAPKKYTDLLSDESTNRLLLKWLKQWDYVVFNKERKEKGEKEKKRQQVQQNKTENKVGKDGKPFKNFKSNLPEVTDELDDHNRPLNKISLLSGPPGLGKTTLAHIIARHCGYNVVEINASDDRSAELFKTKIEAATQMKSVLGADPRPNCLIIDEIDGAPAPAINQLIQMIKGPQENANKKKKKQGNLLLRPIICICNDVYVPSLRQLRQLALHVKIPPTLSSRLASRLSEVSKKEKLKADMTSLLALCEKADNDIRSCLNTLQFIKGRLKELSLYSVQSLSLGQKDAHKSLFSVWQSIFKMPRPTRKRYVNPFERGSLQEVEQMQQLQQQNNTSHAARFQKILDTAQASGEYEKIMQGLYENYLESKAKDPRMEGIQKACDWICFADQIQLYTNRTQNYTLMRYLPYLPVTFHMYFASNSHPAIQYPQSQFELKTKINRTENLISTLMSDVTPSVKKNLNITITVTEFLSPLTEIIQPSLRPVNTQLYSAREKAELSHLIHVMIAYNMTYHQERTPEGQYTYVLEPNIDDVVRFPGTKPQKQQLTYAAKQLIAREIDMEKMRKAEFSSRAIESGPKPQKSTADLPSHLRQTLTPKAISSKEDKEWTPERPVTDFFGRVITKAAEKQVKKKEDKKEIIGGDIWFRFKEGFTNAVRKTVRISDLM